MNTKEISNASISIENSFTDPDGSTKEVKLRIMANGIEYITSKILHVDDLNSRYDITMQMLSDTLKDYILSQDRNNYKRR